MAKKMKNSDDDTAPTKNRRVRIKDVHEKLDELCQDIDKNNSNINAKFQFIAEELMNLNFNLVELKKKRSLFKTLSSRYDLKLIFAGILILCMAFFGATWLLANL